ncbi:hypothetical protein K1719_043393 [Acacia pycnantha]|nr:hypothetical protein K1719_043393 [Acacia pycnantha]
MSCPSCELLHLHNPQLPLKPLPTSPTCSRFPHPPVSLLSVAVFSALWLLSPISPSSLLSPQSVVFDHDDESYNLENKSNFARHCRVVIWD